MDIEYLDYKSSQRQKYLNKKDDKKDSMKGFQKLYKPQIDNIKLKLKAENSDEEDKKIDEFLEDEKKRGKLKVFTPYIYRHYNKHCSCDSCGQIYKKEFNKYKIRNYICNGTLENPNRIEKIYEYTTL